MTTQHLYDSVEDLENQLLAGGVTLMPASPTDEVERVKMAEGDFEVRAGALNPHTGERRRENLVRLYRTDTGEPVDVDVNQALVYLRKRFPAVDSTLRAGVVGQRAFTLGVKDPQTGSFLPPKEYKRGEFKCMLNPESPERELIERIGLAPTCPYKSGPTYFAMTEHMRKKHSSEWQAIQLHRQEEERRQEREQTAELNRRLVEIAASQAAPPAAPVAATVTVEEPKVEEPNEDSTEAPTNRKRRGGSIQPES